MLVSDWFSGRMQVSDWFSGGMVVSDWFSGGMLAFHADGPDSIPRLQLIYLKTKKTDSDLSPDCWYLVCIF